MYQEGGGQEVRRRIAQQTYQSPIAPQRVVLKPNLNHERQDTTSSDATKSFDYSDKHGGTYGETCRGEIDFNIQGLPQSAVQEQDHTRKEAVQKLIHQFETHPNREVLKPDMKQNHAFNPFSEQSKEMIYSMGNMEYFEICEITPKVQCHNCVTCWTKGSLYCTCALNMAQNYEDVGNYRPICTLPALYKPFFDDLVQQTVFQT